MQWRKDAHFIEALYVVFLALCLVFLSSCSHDPKLEKKIDSETAALPVLSPAARADAADKTFQSAALSDEQKEKLEMLTVSTNTELQQLHDQGARLRLLLVQQLVNPQASDREIDAIKKRILETDRKSNKVWISALDDARHILGRRNEQDRKFYQAFRQEPLQPEILDHKEQRDTPK